MIQADSEKPMRELAEVIVGMAANDYPIPVIAGRLAVFARELVRQAFAGAARAQCMGCRDGATLITNVYHADGYGSCEAVRIRAVINELSADESEVGSAEPGEAHRVRHAASERWGVNDSEG